ncbi:hypothetical protein [Spirosoma koreense]
MNDNKLNEWITGIQANTDPEKAYINFFMYGGGVDESAIRANKDGLLLFAQRLIQAANEIDKVVEGKTVSISDEYAEWIDSESEICFHYVEKVSGYTNSDEPETWQDRIEKYFIFALFISAVGIFILGLWTLVNFFR